MGLRQPPSFPTFISFYIHLLHLDAEWNGLLPLEGMSVDGPNDGMIRGCISEGQYATPTFGFHYGGLRSQISDIGFVQNT